MERQSTCRQGLSRFVINNDAIVVAVFIIRRYRRWWSWLIWLSPHMRRLEVGRLVADLKFDHILSAASQSRAIRRRRYSKSTDRGSRTKQLKKLILDTANRHRGQHSPLETDFSLQWKQNSVHQLMLVSPLACPPSCFVEHLSFWRELCQLVLHLSQLAPLLVSASVLRIRTSQISLVRSTSCPLFQHKLNQ